MGDVVNRLSWAREAVIVPQAAHREIYIGMDTNCIASQLVGVVDAQVVEKWPMGACALR